MHRFQHIYMFFLYAVSTIAWLYVTDFIKYFQKKVSIAEMKMPLKEHLIFWGSKLLYIGVAVVLPVIMVGWMQWLIGYLIVMTVMGVVVSTVFQLAHVVEKTTFETKDDEEKQVINSEWAVHELKTTANFAPRNKVVSWFVGGLNFQVEHHLFPRISHVHYPAISKIVENHCRKFNVPYHVYNTTRGAIASHVRLMKRLGQEEFAG